jgi:phage terminase large subunit GpA-like protein
MPKGMQNAWQLDCEVFAEAIRPDPALTVAEWADAYRVLSSETSSEPGRWRTERVPYAREIMEALSPSAPFHEVTFVAGTQVGKTEIGNNFIGYIIDWSPGPAMMVYPTSNTGKRSSKTRLAKMIESTARLRAKISDASRDASNSASLKQFPGGVLAIAGANSAAELKSMPVRYLFEDEVDEYPDDVDGQGPADELAEKRTDTFARKKIFRTSTPTVKGRSKIWRHLERSDFRRYHVSCPHCARAQPLEWEQMRWELRHVRELHCRRCGVISAVADGADAWTNCPACAAPVAEDGADCETHATGEVLDAWIECRGCEARIDEHAKTRLLAGGRWVATKPENRGRAGFHLSALYSPLGWYSWREAVAKHLQAEADPSGELKKIFANTVLGLPYVDASEDLSGLDLTTRAEPYRLGTVPAGGLFLSGGVDVQQKRIEVKVKAWGRDEESWLVDYQVLHGDTEQHDVWDALDEYLQKRFPHEWGTTLQILSVAVDSGFRTQTVYDWCRRRRHRNVIPVKGQSEQGKTILGRPKKQDVDHRGKILKAGVELWPVGTDTAKAKIYARLKITEPGPGRMHFPGGLPDEYYTQLTAERLVSRYHKGYLKTGWEKDAGARNEALDLEVYAYAAAIFAGLTRVNWDRLEASLRATAGDLFVTADRVTDAVVERSREVDAVIKAPAVPPPHRRPASNWVTGFRS